MVFKFSFEVMLLTIGHTGLPLGSSALAKPAGLIRDHGTSMLRVNLNNAIRCFHQMGMAQVTVARLLILH